MLKKLPRKLCPNNKVHIQPIFVNKEGFDIIEQESYSVLDYINKENGNIVIFINNTVTLLNINTLIKYTCHNCFYECIKDEIIKTDPYIKIHTTIGPVFVNYEYVFDMYKKVTKENIRYFRLIKIKTINYSISHDDLYREVEDEDDYNISYNIYIEGTNIDMYDICILSK